MPGRRSISVEPENIAVASPRRSSRIKINHQDSPLPVNKTTEQAIPAKRTRRSSSIQEKSLSDIKNDVKKTQDDEKPKTPARRTRRSISAQEEQKPVLKEISVKLTRSEIKEVVKDNEDEKQQEQQKDEEQKTPPPQDLENPGGRPKGRVTRSMSKSPVSLKNAKPVLAPVTRSRRLSLNDKQTSESKVSTLDIITENESEHEKIEETTETDVLNNNKKQTEISENESTTEEIKTEDTAEVTDKNETETMDIPGDTIKEEIKNLNESAKDTLNTSIKRSPKKFTTKDENKTELNEAKSERIEEQETKLNKEKIEIMEMKLNELIEEGPENNLKEELSEEVESKECAKIQETQDDIVEDADKLNESNISLVGNTSVNLNGSILKENVEVSRKLLDDDERPQNIALVNDDGRSYSPIIPKTDISVLLNDSRKSLNSTISTPHKLNISSKTNTSQTMESLQISTKDDDEEQIIDETINTKDISANLDDSKKSIKSTPAKSINDSVTSVKSLESGKKSNKSTPIRATDDKENNDMNISNSNKNKSSSKRASINQLREQILDDYIATFTAEKKRKRESMDATELDSSENSKKRRSGQMTKVSSCNFSDDDEESDGESKNDFIDDAASVGTEDTPSIGSNDIIDDGESVGSSNSEHDSNETYESDSFVVDDDEVEDEELLSGTEDFLGNLSMPKKRKRILKMDSDSEEEEKDKLDNMSMEPYGGMSPSNMSEKQISSIDSDLESIKTRNEELSKQIEDGTLVPEVEAKREIEDSESDDDIIIVEENPKDSSNIEVKEDKHESLKEHEEIKDIQKETIEEAIDIQKETIEEVEDIQKETIEQAKDIRKDNNEEVEDIQNETIEEVKDIQKENNEEMEDIQKETIEEVEDIQKENNEEVEDIQKETIEEVEDILEKTVEEAEENANETNELSITSNTQVTEKIDADETIYNQPEEDEEIDKKSDEMESTNTSTISESMEEIDTKQREYDTKKQDEDEEEEDKETKYKKLLEKYFNVTNKNRTRRQTIGEEIAKTTVKSSRKRKTSLEIEFRDTTNEETKNKFVKDHQKNETQIIEVKIDSKHSDTKYEFNNSGVFQVSPIKTEKSSQIADNDESLLMLQDFNDSLNDSLDLITSSNKKNTSQISEENILNNSSNSERSSKKKQKQNNTPVKSSEESENSNTGSGKKKRKKNQLDTSINELSNEENIGGKKKRKQHKSKENEKTEITTERDTVLEEDTKSSIEIEMSENEISPKKNRKMTDAQNEIHKKKKSNRKQLVSSESEKTFQSSTDSEKESSIKINNKNRKKNKSPQCMFNFKVENEKLSPSKSEIEYENYVPPKHRNIYKNLIKPSSSGFSGSNQFIIKDLVSKVSHGIKKQKYNNTKLNKISIAGMTNNANWKETLLTEGMVKAVNISNASTLRKHK